MIKKISIIEPIGIDLKPLCNQFAPHQMHIIDSRGWSDSQLIAALSESHLIALTNRPLSYAVITALPQLEMIAVAFAGVDHINAKALREKNIVLKNATGYANTAVAELVIGLMISLARQIPRNHMMMTQNIGTNTGTELRNKTLGIVGYGHIGRTLETLAHHAFGMQILCYGRNGSRAQLEALFAQSDYVSLHLPLTDATRGMIDYTLFKRMKPSAYFINCARGPIVKQNDLIQALEKKQIKGAAIDVFETEPPLDTLHPLLKQDNVIATPHIGFNTQEALLAKGQMTVDHMMNFLNDKK